MTGNRLAGLVGALILAAPAWASEERSTISYDGVYTAWWQMQRDFTFGASGYEDSYTVQMLRMNVRFEASEHLEAVTRFDLAQGWWGVDNADRTADRDPDATPGGSKLFDYKDTNFLFHVDHAYALVRLPDQHLVVRIGRMKYATGKRLVLDNNYDGVQADVAGRLELAYAKVSEGLDGLTDLELTDEQGNVVADGDDAHLAVISVVGDASAVAYEAYGLYYVDAGDDDGSTFLPNDLNYFRSRFTPNVSQLVALGIAGTYDGEERGLRVEGEANVLFGKDDVENPSIDARQLVDVNDGDLRGYNLYVRADKDLNDTFAFGVVLGLGSGDDDVTGGNGNVNKLRTSGFFYVTELWEDSIMPDEEGITPQGLGAPNVRGYRELENTTLVQLNGTVRLHPKITAFASYTYLRATEDVFSWSASDVETVIGTESANDLGQEVDWKLDYQLYPRLALAFRGGIFVPGDAAGYLINGTDMYDDTAWETKLTATLRF